MFKLGLPAPGASLAQVMEHLRTPLYRNAYGLIFSDAASSALGMIYWVIAARLYLSEQVGYNSAAISTMMMVSGIAALPLRGAMVRFMPSAGRRTRLLVQAMYAISTLLALLFGLLMFIGSSLSGADQSFLLSNSSFALWFVAMIFVWNIFTLQDTALTGLRKVEWVALENICFGVVKILLLLLFARFLPTYGIFLSWTIPALIALVPINWFLFWRAIPRHSALVAADEQLEPASIARLVVGDFVGTCFSVLAVTLMPILVLNVLGAAANAAFYLAWIIAYPLQLIAMNIATSLTVEAASQQHLLNDYSRRSAVQMARLILPATLVLVISAPFLLSFFGTEYAAQSTHLLQLLALSAIPFAINAWQLGLARIQQRIALIICMQFGVLLITMIAGYLLMPSLGIVAIGVSWLISQLFGVMIIGMFRLGRALRPSV